MTREVMDQETLEERWEMWETDFLIPRGVPEDHRRQMRASFFFGARETLALMTEAKTRPDPSDWYDTERGKRIFEGLARTLGDFTRELEAAKAERAERAKPN